MSLQSPTPAEVPSGLWQGVSPSAKDSNPGKSEGTENLAYKLGVGAWTVEHKGDTIKNTEGGQSGQ